MNGGPPPTLIKRMDEMSDERENILYYWHEHGDKSEIRKSKDLQLIAHILKNEGGDAGVVTQVDGRDYFYKSVENFPTQVSIAERLSDCAEELAYDMAEGEQND